LISIALAEVERKQAPRASEKGFCCHSETRFSPKNLSVDCASIDERVFASLRMTEGPGFFAACEARPQLRVGDGPNSRDTNGRKIGAHGFGGFKCLFDTRPDGRARQIISGEK
jgi:hypothetical protein